MTEYCCNTFKECIENDFFRKNTSQTFDMNLIDDWWVYPESEDEDGEKEPYPEKDTQSSDTYELSYCPFCGAKLVP